MLSDTEYYVPPWFSGVTPKDWEELRAQLVTTLARLALATAALHAWVRSQADDGGECDPHGYAALMDGLTSESRELLANSDPLAALLLTLVEAASKRRTAHVAAIDATNTIVDRNCSAEIFATMDPVLDSERDATNEENAAIDALRLAAPWIGGGT